MTHSTNKDRRVSEGSGQNKLFALIIVGIVVPLLAALVPWVIDRWVPQNRLVYSVSDSIGVPCAASISLRIKNEGRLPERNVEIWLPLGFSNAIKNPINDENILSSIGSGKPTLITDSSLKVSKSNYQNGFLVLYYDVIRPSESVDIPLFIIGKDAFLHKGRFFNMRVVSETTVGQMDIPNELLESIYRNAFTLSLIFTILLIIAVFLVKDIKIESIESKDNNT